MASRFWVGGTGTWDASDTTHWAATSGGAGGQSVPTASDTATFDASSGGGTVTVNTTVNISSKFAHVSPRLSRHSTFPRRLSQRDVHNKRPAEAGSERYCHVPNVTNVAMIAIVTKSRVLFSALENICNAARVASTGMAIRVTAVCIRLLPSELRCQQ